MIQELIEKQQKINELKESLKTRLFPVLKNFYFLTYGKQFDKSLTENCIINIEIDVKHKYGMISFCLPDGNWDILNIPFDFIENYEKI